MKAFYWSYIAYTGGAQQPCKPSRAEGCSGCCDPDLGDVLLLCPLQPCLLTSAPHLCPLYSPAPTDSHYNHILLLTDHAWSHITTPYLCPVPHTFVHYPHLTSLYKPTPDFTLQTHTRPHFPNPHLTSLYKLANLQKLY